MRVYIDVPPTPRALKALSRGLVSLNRYLLNQGDFPPLYKSGVIYKAEPRGQEEWVRADKLYVKKYGDCEDLSAVRAAELQNLGEYATVDILPTGFRRFHAVVERGDGRIEDPSLRLGMKVSRR